MPRRPSSLRATLLLIVLLPTIAATLFACWLVWDSYQREIAQAQGQAQRDAHQIALRLSRRILVIEAGLAGLSETSAIQTGDFERARAQAVKLASDLKIRAIALHDTSGTPQFTTLRPWGQALARPQLDGSFAAVLKGESVVRLARPSPSSDLVVAVSVPVKVDGEVRFGLAASMSQQELQSILAGSDLSPGWIATVLDPADCVAARSVGAERFVGAIATEPLRSALRGGNDTNGAITGVALDGTPVFAFFSKELGWGWSVVVSVPSAEIKGRAIRTGLGILAIGLALITSSLLLAWRLSGRVTRSMRSLMEGAEPLSRAEVVKFPALGFAEAEMVARTLTSASERLHLAHEHLVEKNQELAELHLAAAHDLRTPMIALAGHVDVLALRHRAELGEDGMARLDRIQSALLQLRGLMDGLFSVARLEFDARPSEVVDLADIVRKARTLLDGDIERSGASISVTGSWTAVHGNPTELLQLFVNLLSNALKYRDPETLPAIHLHAHTDSERNTCIQVADNGIGIEPEQREAVFSLFRRLKPAVANGTGVGLPMCKRIVTRHSGRIWIQANEPLGTIVNVILRSADAAEDGAAR